MGLHMDNIHTPSVPSAPTSSSHPPKSSDADKTPLLDLIADKDRVEGELKALMGVLQSVLPLLSYSLAVSSIPILASYVPVIQDAD